MGIDTVQGAALRPSNIARNGEGKGACGSVEGRADGKSLSLENLQDQDYIPGWEVAATGCPFYRWISSRS